MALKNYTTTIKTEKTINEIQEYKRRIIVLLRQLMNKQKEQRGEILKIG